MCRKVLTTFKKFSTIKREEQMFDVIVFIERGIM